MYILLSICVRCFFVVVVVVDVLTVCAICCFADVISVLLSARCELIPGS